MRAWAQRTIGAALAVWTWLVGILRSGLSRRGNDAAELVLPRRRWLANVTVGLAGLAAFFGRTRPARAGRLNDNHHAWAMVIDLDRCSGCGACTIACRQENNVPVLGPEPVNQGARVEWMSLLWHDSEGRRGTPEIMPFSCQHCESAPCTKVCPVGATYKSPDGITAQIWDRCIGCRYCMAACPYARRSFNWTEPKWDGDQVQMLNPDVGTRPRGVVEKCTFCHHRIQAVHERAAMNDREPTDDELVHLTACASACPARAISFGDLSNEKSTVSRGTRNPRAFRLLEHLGTRPRVTYLKRDRRA